MQSAEDHEQDCAALELSKTCNNKENNDSSSVRPRLRSAGRLRGLGHAGSARDAPERKCIELSDGEHAELLAYLAEQQATREDTPARSTEEAARHWWVPRSQGWQCLDCMRRWSPDVGPRKGLPHDFLQVYGANCGHRPVAAQA